ncbi:C-Jun-amino-terminal kinase-interacting protein 1-like [Branchiostoma lanceolatum]|uniref:C-Jun-amino-terminal kinase-interacting protein 1-like n=1 Tax=Branchiostoma lanceolatum TaxID=7740 RepID=UPI0034526255
MMEERRRDTDFSREILQPVKSTTDPSRTKNLYRLSGKVSLDESAAEFSSLDSWESDMPSQLVQRTSFSNISFKGDDKTTDEIGAQMSQIDEGHIQLDIQDFPNTQGQDGRHSLKAFAETRQEVQELRQLPVRKRSSHGSRRGRKLPEVPTTRRRSPATVPPMVVGSLPESETETDSTTGSRLLDEAQIPSTAFSSTSLESKPFLRPQNPFLEDAASPVGSPGEESEEEVDPILMVGAYTEGNSTFYDSEEPDPAVPSIVVRGKKREQTHRALYRFIPRHQDELALNVADPLYVEREAEDLWFEGWNIRTEKYGVFPSAYAYEVGAEQEEIGFSGKVHVDRYTLKFLGSVEVPYHKGNDVLCQAMEKVVKARRMTLHTKPPQVCAVDISDKGVKMVENSNGQRKESVKWGKLFGGSKKPANNERQNYFFALKNISFGGYHPKNNRYFGFITKHPAERRFACHVLVSEESTRPVAEALGRAFRKFYAEYMDYTHPTEDIYME